MDRPTSPQLPEHVHIRSVVSTAEIAVGDAHCCAPPGPFAAPETVDETSLVLVRRGVFRRRTAAGEFTLDPTLAYCARGGEMQQFAHPCAGGDATTLIQVSETLAAALAPELPRVPLTVPPGTYVAHRALLAGVRTRDPDLWVERAIVVFASALAAAGEAAPPPRGPARRRLVDDTRAVLAERPDAELPAVARAVGASPWHLSRLFREQTGTTISAHRARLRTRAAVERLAGGETNLAGLAADLGFADHAHLTRTVKRETGHTPRALRRFLCGAYRH
jgi:AraC-like DNA-binding protein